MHHSFSNFFAYQAFFSARSQKRMVYFNPVCTRYQLVSSDETVHPHYKKLEMPVMGFRINFSLFVNASAINLGRISGTPLFIRVIEEEVVQNERKGSKNSVPLLCP